MATIIKTIKNKAGDTILPRTTTQAVSTPDGGALADSLIYLSDGTPTNPVPIDAQTLDGFDSTYFGRIPVILYDNATGAGSVTLSETALNYTSLEVYVSEGDKSYCVKTSNAGSFGLTSNRTGFFDSFFALRIAGGYITVSGTTVSASTTGENYTIDLRTTGAFVFRDTATTYIIKRVIGYR